MKYKTAIYGVFVLALISLGVTKTYASPPSDIHITADGKFSATNVVVFQKAGTADFFTRVTWGGTFVRVTVLSHNDTVVTKAHGEKAVPNDIQEGDVLQVDGTLANSDGGLVVDAKKIVDTSLQVELKTVSGAVKSVDVSHASFVLPNKVFGNATTIAVSTTTTITKGVRTIGLLDISVGDKITSVSGAYDYPSNTLSASTIVVYQDKSVFVPQNFQGVLKSISGTTLPVVCTITVNNVDYTLYLSAGASIVSSNKSTASLSRFVIGDTVRAYGAIRQTNLKEIDASVLRDLNF